MRYHNITKADMLNGEGLRVVLWVSGCNHECPGCQNALTWNPEDGLEFDENAIKEIYQELDQDWCNGITLSGGDPLFPGNRRTIRNLVTAIHEKYPNKTIWCYTGYNFEKDVLGNMYKKFDFTPKFLKNVDIIVDGQFEEENKIIDLRFRGSTNQRKIDVQQSLKNNKLVQLDFGDENRYSKELLTK